MLTFRIALTARAAVNGACMALAAAALVSGCGGAPPATTAATTSVTTVVAAQTNSLPGPGVGPATTTAPGVYGNPAAAAKYWAAQSLEDNCGLVSLADVVGEATGNAPTERQMLDLAESTPSGANPGPIYAPRNDPSHSGPNAGNSMSDLVILLDHFGIKSEMTSTSDRDKNGLPLLEQYLANDRKIIAFVNSSVILNGDDQRTTADHFLVVTGIDTGKEIVHLNDPGIDHADEQVSFGTFATAWQTSDQSIVVTAVPG
ncbi:C39 family peptidase [Mycobacterium senriense]